MIGGFGPHGPGPYGRAEKPSSSSAGSRRSRRASTSFTGYLCRIVAGHEETGYKRDFTIRGEDALDTGRDPKYGISLVSRGGYVYDGCRSVNGSDWACDYQTRKQVSREHYESKGYVAQTFWKWKDYIKSQAGCAAAITGLWSKAPSKGFLFFLGECNNGPL